MLQSRSQLQKHRKRPKRSQVRQGHHLGEESCRAQEEAEAREVAQARKAMEAAKAVAEAEAAVD